MSKTVLVTGVNGFVGRHLARELHDSGYSVVGAGGPSGNTDGIEGCLTDYLVVDLTDKDAVNNVELKNIQSVIHLAGLAAVGPSFDEPMKYITSNVGMETHLFQAAVSQGVFPKFLIISSGSLYDSQAPLPLSETSSVIPSSPYAVSKIGQEQMARYYGLRGFETIIARPFNHIGPGQGEGFILPDLTKQVVAVERGEASSIQVGNLEAKRDYTDVRDIVRAYRLLLEGGKPGETYNICSGVSRSGQQILDTLIARSGIQTNIEQDPARMRPSDTPDIYGSNEKLRNDTGWEPQLDLDQTINDILEDWRSK